MPIKYISGESVYGWRVLTDQELASNRFVPFSQRYNTHKIIIWKILTVIMKIFLK